MASYLCNPFKELELALEYFRAKSEKLIEEEMRAVNSNPVAGLRGHKINDDSYKWEVQLKGLLLYEGRFFKAHLHFPKEYPLRPPRMKFVTEISHPNIEKNGDVCISILASPDGDISKCWGTRRWDPHVTVEQILFDVMYMISHPNFGRAVNTTASEQ